MYGRKRSSSITGSANVYVVLANGKEVEWEYSAQLVRDPDYGADADGNRGVEMTTIEDFCPVGNIEQELKHDAYGNPLTDEERAEAIELLDDAAEQADYEFDDDESYWADVEYDRQRDDELTGDR